MTRRLALRIWLGFGTALLTLAAVAGAWLYWVSQAQADYERLVDAPGLSGPLEIYRDAYGVPHIFAQTQRDALFALGYVQGQDRGWQMEFLRRAVDGRMSEIAGAALIDLDREFLASGAARLADASLALYRPETIDAIEAFAAGVNLAIEQGQYQASPEFRAFGVSPAPWTPREVGALTYLIGASVDQVSGEALWRKRLVDDLGERRADLLAQDFDADWPTLFRDIGVLDEAAARATVALEAAGLPVGQRTPGASKPPDSAGKGTNFFLLGPEKSTTGAPILAVDPHLELDAPSLFYPVSITLPNQVIRGAAWVTSPAVHFGHNSSIAWGMTAMAVDNAHFLVERIDPKDPGAYLRPEGSRRFEVEMREIAVRWRSDPVRMRLRYTEAGRVVSDFDPKLKTLADAFGPGHVIVRKSATLLNGQFYLESGLRVQFADDWVSFRAAFERHGNPNTVAYADSAGNIGVLTAAHTPIRRAPETWGTIPRAWLGEGEWAGVAPYEAMPYAYNPARAFVADSNARLVPGDFPLFLTARASSPYRIARSEAVLSAPRRFSVEDVATLQQDSYSTRADIVLGAALPLLARANGAMAVWTERLRGWDRRMDKNRPEPLVYTAFEHALHRRLIGEKISDREYGDGRGDPITLARLLRSEEAAFWCDGIATPTVETCEDAVAEAFGAGLAELSRAYGRDHSRWRWGDAHKARFANRYFLDFLPFVSDWAARSTEISSDPGTLNVGGWSGGKGAKYNQNSGAVWRQIIDLSNLDNSRFQIAPGVSGNPASPFYDSTFEAWSAGEYVSLARSRADLIRERAPKTILRPK
jgi:penicillin amidase